MSSCSGRVFSPTQSIYKLQSRGEEFISKLLDRKWALRCPGSNIHQIKFSPTNAQEGEKPLGSISFVNKTSPLLGNSMVDARSKETSFYVVRDDLLHPFVNGNKARKLDSLLPLIEDHSVTDVVTCGGCQSAHTAAVAVSCAEQGIRSHLLLRGEQPNILTGYNLISKMYGNVTYVPRSLYANREEMLRSHANVVAGDGGSVVWFNDIFENSLKTKASNNLKFLEAKACNGGENHPKKVVIINEGAGDAVALLGVIRLVKYLSQNHLFGKERALKFIVDAGTGTTAVGLGLAAYCLGLPWEVIAVMLADTIDGYKNQEKRLISDFKKLCALYDVDHAIDGMDDGLVKWVKRDRPRRFGKVLKGEVEACQHIAQQTGVLLDPIYTLAAWELATRLSEKEASMGTEAVMLHTGGTLGLFGLAQRYKSDFERLKGVLSI